MLADVLRARCSQPHSPPPELFCLLFASRSPWGMGCDGLAGLRDLPASSHSLRGMGRAATEKAHSLEASRFIPSTARHSPPSRSRTARIALHSLRGTSLAKFERPRSPAISGLDTWGTPFLGR